MKNSILFTLMLVPLLGISQAESELAKKKSAQFEEYYNADNYQKIFELFSADMKAALPIEKTTAIASDLKAQFGKIESREFIRYENGAFAVYKTKFEKAVLSLLVAVNDKEEINGLLVKPFVENTLPRLTRNKTKLILPFKGEWTVFWGGDTKELNYHVEHEAQKHAFDLIITDNNGKSYINQGEFNEDYFAFGRELVAPCDAEVVLVVDGIKDNKPGETNPIYVPGNTVILRTANNEYLFFAHFKQHSIVVEQGQQVKQGQRLGLCGNSGNSTEPHLHFHIQNIEDMVKATGVKCYFDNIIVNGEVKNDYSPIKGEKVKAK